eukprot:96398_1
MEEELEDDINDIDHELFVTPNYFTVQLYKSFKEEIDQIFRTHFQLNDDFVVKYKHRLAIKRGKMSFIYENDEREEDKTTYTNENVMNRMINLQKMKGLQNNDDDSQVQNILTKYFQARSFNIKIGETEMNEIFTFFKEKVKLNDKRYNSCDEVFLKSQNDGDGEYDETQLTHGNNSKTDMIELVEIVEDTVKVGDETNNFAEKNIN